MAGVFSAFGIVVFIFETNENQLNRKQFFFLLLLFTDPFGVFFHPKHSELAGENIFMIVVFVMTFVGHPCLLTTNTL